jgi:polar amino acid transport system substrate-binding protein
MKIIFTVLVVTISISGCSRPTTDLKNQTLRMATEGVAPPFNFYQGQELTGFEVELAGEMAKRAGLKSEWQTLPFESLLLGLDRDHYDAVVASHAITEEREKAVDFLDPH